MGLPDPVTAVLISDRDLAERHDVEFSVVSRPAGSGPRHGSPARHGTFRDPADAVALARSLDGRDVMVLADGHGAYWHTTEPDQVHSDLLVVVCRDKRLGPEEAQREHDREHWRLVIEQLRAEQRMAEAIDVIRRCGDEDEAERRLRSHSPPFSRFQAKHLVGNRRLGLLTTHGQRELSSEIDDAVTALDSLGPSPED